MPPRAFIVLLEYFAGENHLQMSQISRKIDPTRITLARQKQQPNNAFLTIATCSTHVQRFRPLNLTSDDEVSIFP